MTKSEALKVAENQIEWNINDIVDLMRDTFKDLSEAKNNASRFFSIMDSALITYNNHQERIREAMAQKHAIEAVTAL